MRPLNQKIMLKCISPTLIRLKQTNHIYAVGCGKCYACMEKKRTELAARLNQDLPYAYESLFITLTYDDDHLPQNGVDLKTGEYKPLPSVSKDEMQRFLKRLRKYLNLNKDNAVLKYYLTGEYGDLDKRPHYHSIIYILPKAFDNDSSVPDVSNYVVPPLQSNMTLKEAVLKSWKKHDLTKLSINKVVESIHSDGALKYVAKHQVKRCKGLDEQAPTSPYVVKV